MKDSLDRDLNRAISLKASQREILPARTWAIILTQTWPL